MVTEKAPPLITPLLGQFMFAMILANTAGAMVYTLLPVYLANLGASVGQIGLVFSVASLVPLALQVFGGWLSDTIGRLRAVALGSLGGLVGYIGFLLAPSWEWVLVALCFEYTSGALVGPSFAAFIAEQSTEYNRGRVFGVSKGLFMTISVIGPPLGGMLAFRLGFKAMLTGAALFYMTATLLRIWMALRYPPAARTEPVPLHFGSLRTSLGLMFGMLAAGGVLTWIFITDGIRDVAFRLSDELLPLYFSKIGGVSVEQIGWLHAVLGVCMIVVSVPAGWLSDRRGERLVISAGFFVQVLAVLVFVSFASLTGFVVTMALFGIGAGLLSPAYDSFVSKVVPANLRGIAFGLFHTSLGIISMPAPWVGARLWEAVHPTTPFYLTGAAAFVAVILAWFKFRLPANEKPVDQTGLEKLSMPE